jgi:Transglutaminase-like superfamily
MQTGRLDTGITYALHAIAWLTLRVQPPRSALRTVGRIARVARPFVDVEEARLAAKLLSKHGTCLSRSVTIAARLPGSQVVIGVDPRWTGRLSAHAWVELGGEAVESPGLRAHGEAIARL